MGKTANDPTCSSPVRGDGEIALLADQGVEHLEAHLDHQANEEQGLSFGSAVDDRAILNAMAHLRQTATGSRADEEALQDLAIDLYNRICAGIRSGKMTQQQIVRAAEILGERPEELSSRVLGD